MDYNLEYIIKLYLSNLSNRIKANVSLHGIYF